jgi:hypothetical protein
MRKREFKDGRARESLMANAVAAGWVDGRETRRVGRVGESVRERTFDERSVGGHDVASRILPTDRDQGVIIYHYIPVIIYVYIY